MRESLKDRLLHENLMLEYLDEFMNLIREEKKIIMFGAGRGGINTYSFIKNREESLIKNIICFIDNNPLKWGTQLQGIPVYKPSEQLGGYCGELILITCGEGEVIRRQLNEEYAVPAKRIFVPDISAIDVTGNDYNYIWSHIDAYDAVYNLLSDDKSRDCFVNLLNYRMSHKKELIREIADSDDMQYFDSQLVHFSEEDIFFNCGAYTGDTIENLIRKNHCVYNKIYACEADTANFNIMKENDRLQNIHNFTPLHIGVWNKKCELSFNDVGSGSGYIDEGGSQIIQVDTIDNILEGRKVTFINMDIEGSEYEALLGAYDTIKNYRPILAISVYHKQDDFLKLIMLMKSMNPDYKIYLRHYRTEAISETVCYAIP